VKLLVNLPWFVTGAASRRSKYDDNCRSPADAVLFASSPSPSARVQMLINSPADPLRRQLRQQ